MASFCDACGRRTQRDDLQTLKMAWVVGGINEVCTPCLDEANETETEAMAFVQKAHEEVLRRVRQYLLDKREAAKSVVEQATHE